MGDCTASMTAVHTLSIGRNVIHIRLDIYQTKYMLDFYYNYEPEMRYLM